MNYSFSPILRNKILKMRQNKEPSNNVREEVMSDKLSVHL